MAEPERIAERHRISDAPWGAAFPAGLGLRKDPTRRRHVIAVAAPARDRTVHCSMGVNAPGVNADEQVAGQS